MLTELCQELNNWFDVDRYFGVFTIEDGELSAPFLQDGQYYRIVGSVFNDGVYQYHVREAGDGTEDPETDGEAADPETPEEAQDPETAAPELTDEVFDGAVWAMAVPPAVIALAEEIGAWQEKYGGVDSAAMSPFASESFGGYSYSKGSRSGSGAAEGGNSGTWQGAFADRLNRWRKIRP